MTSRTFAFIITLIVWTCAALQEHGTDFAAIASAVGSKTEAQCQTFYNANKGKHNLEPAPPERERDKVATSDIMLQCC